MAAIELIYGNVLTLGPLAQVVAKEVVFPPAGGGLPRARSAWSTWTLVRATLEFRARLFWLSRVSILFWAHLNWNIRQRSTCAIRCIKVRDLRSGWGNA
jgi:hypothetical protein